MNNKRIADHGQMGRIDTIIERKQSRRNDEHYV